MKKKLRGGTKERRKERIGTIFCGNVNHAWTLFETPALHLILMIQLSLCFMVQSFKERALVQPISRERGRVDNSLSCEKSAK